MHDGWSFDVMLSLPLRCRNGRVGRWFLVGMQREEADGLRRFLAVVDEFRGREAVILLVRSILDRTIGRPSRPSHRLHGCWVAAVALAAPPG